MEPAASPQTQGPPSDNLPGPLAAPQGWSYWGSAPTPPRQIVCPGLRCSPLPAGEPPPWLRGGIRVFSLPPPHPSRASTLAGGGHNWTGGSSSPVCLSLDSHQRSRRILVPMDGVSQSHAGGRWVSLGPGRGRWSGWDRWGRVGLGQGIPGSRTAGRREGCLGLRYTWGGEGVL